MNRRKIIIAASIGMLSFIGVLFGTINTENDIDDMQLSSSVEALSSCEITNGKKVLLLCAGETEMCSTTKWGYTLSCSGKKVVP